jgi:hypothetical protein
MLNIRTFRAADCDTDHYLVVAKIRKRLAVNKQGPQKFRMERFNLKKLNEVEVKQMFRHLTTSLGETGCQGGQGSPRAVAPNKEEGEEGKENYRVEISN